MTDPKFMLPFPLLTPSPMLRLVLSAYRIGAFPMGTGPIESPVEFFTADPRCIVPLDSEPRYSRSLRARVRRGPFRITSDVAFAGVLRMCSTVPREFDPDAGELPGTWINGWIIDHFQQLHACGLAHSVEAWIRSDHPAPSPNSGANTSPSAGPAAPASIETRPGWRLVGGLYGLHLGGAFFGESMFSLPEQGGTDASKVAFVELVKRLRGAGFSLLDSQIANSHMRSLGAIEVPAKAYLNRLDVALLERCTWPTFDTLDDPVPSSGPHPAGQAAPDSRPIDPTSLLSNHPGTPED